MFLKMLFMQKNLKYIDNSISSEISKHANIQKAGEELTKELFLEGF